MKKLKIFLMVLVLPILFSCDQKADTEWVSLFDGESLNGWQASENAGSFRVEEGEIICEGERSHLFYMGENDNASFKNFEFKVDVKSEDAANSGVYFHTEYQEEGWPEKGYEVQIHNTYKGEGYRELKKTGSLYAVRNLYNTFIQDNEWFNLHFIVEGKRVQVFVNDKMVVDYIEPDQPVRTEGFAGRLLGEGTFALQGHDPGSIVHFKNIMVKPLPDTTAFDNAEPYLDESLNTRITHLHNIGFPLMDLHVHLKGDLTLEKALDISRKRGINYGIAVNCGLDFPINTDDKLRDYIMNNLEDQPIFKAMQAEGREWMNLFSEEAIGVFDYVFTDAMTFNNIDGQRMHLWINDEVNIEDEQAFMDRLTDTITNIVNTEPIDIYVNATFLPEVISEQYDELWTEERMQKVVNALVENEVALEISARYKIPNAAFIKKAKESGVKFTFGTNNTDSELGHLQYCLDMIDECDLTTQDMYVPEETGELSERAQELAAK